jgi:uncharacterized protein (TIGR03000 family)
MRYTLSLGLLLAGLGVARADYGRLVVGAPADATVTANNYTLSLPSDGVRRVESLDLEAGRSYYYALVATAYRNGQWYTERRTVSVEAGYETAVTFTFPDAITQAQYSPGYQPQYYNSGYQPQNYQAGYQPRFPQGGYTPQGGMTRQPGGFGGPGSYNAPGGATVPAIINGQRVNVPVRNAGPPRGGRN